MDRSGKTCEKCGPAKNHGPTIGIAVASGLLFVGVVVLNRNLLKATAVFNFLKQMRSTGKVKFKALFFALQVISFRCRQTAIVQQIRLTCHYWPAFCWQVVSEFARITSFMGDSKQYPEPANAVSGSLGLANFDVLKFARVLPCYSSSCRLIEDFWTISIADFRRLCLVVPHDRSRPCAHTPTWTFTTRSL